MLLRIASVVGLGTLLISPQLRESGGYRAEQDMSVSNPPGLTFALHTKDDQKQFHLGEIIYIEEAYSASVIGKYFLVQDPGKIEGGFSTRLTFAPDKSVIDRLRESGTLSADAILNANCAGVGSGGGGGCGDCDGKWTLGREPIRFPYALNYSFAILAPGHYTITAQAGNVMSARAPVEHARAIPVRSNQLEIEIVEDHSWSQNQLRLAVSRFERAQRLYHLSRWDERPESSDSADEIVQRTEMAEEMEKAAEAIRFLDTEESLSEAVRLYSGSETLARYENPFWKAIQESQRRSLAVKLLANRMMSEDFVVSERTLDQLTAMSIEQEEPEIFQHEDESSRKQLYPRTLQILRAYALRLGKSIAKKDTEPREAGIKTFVSYARQEYCSGQPLIDAAMVEQIVQRARSVPN